MISTPPCTLNVPAITEQADGSGVQTGHVSGSCSFRWHTRNEIWYKDRWHVLGVNTHGPYASNTLISEPIDREDYGELYGQWKEVVKVYDPTGTLRMTVTGPVSTID